MLDLKSLYDSILDHAEKFMPVLDVIAGVVVPGLDLDDVVETGKSLGTVIDKAVDLFDDDYDDEKKTLQEKKDELDLKIEAVQQHANATRAKLRGD